MKTINVQKFDSHYNLPNLDLIPFGRNDMIPQSMHQIHRLFWLFTLNLTLSSSCEHEWYDLDISVDASATATSTELSTAIVGTICACLPRANLIEAFVTLPPSFHHKQRTRRYKQHHSYDSQGERPPHVVVDPVRHPIPSIPTGSENNHGYQTAQRYKIRRMKGFTVESQGRFPLFTRENLYWAIRKEQHHVSIVVTGTTQERQRH